MRILKIVGVTLRDRRKGRMLAVAAATLMVLSVSTAQAGVTDFVIDSSQSFLKQSTKLTGPVFGPPGQATSVPQQPGSDTASLYGRMYVDVQPGSLQFLNSASLGAPQSIGAPNSGNYSPAQAPNGDPIPGTQPGQYGLAIPGIGLQAVQYGIKWDWTPSGAMALTGNNFNAAGKNLTMTNGTQAFVSALGNDDGSVAGTPTILGSNGTAVGTWDGTTLTIPINSVFSFQVTSDFGGITQYVYFTGQIVAHPAVPEPSTMMLAGFGVVGLLGYAWRARKHKKLVG